MAGIKGSYSAEGRYKIEKDDEKFFLQAIDEALEDRSPTDEDISDILDILDTLDEPEDS